MNILLVAMPDMVPLVSTIVSFPNIGIASIAGNLKNHDVKVVDLVVYGTKIRKPLIEAIETSKPGLIGLSAMTFQFDTLLKIAAFVKKAYPHIKIAAGGYHATLMYQEIADNAGPDFALDFLVRGEGEVSFRQLADELEKPHPDLSTIKGLSYRGGHGWIHNEKSPLLDLADVSLPARDLRIARDFRWLGKEDVRLDVFETSRGCPFNCKFCSITQMYGRTFRRYPIPRIVADLQNIRRLGSRGAFLADDNVISDAEHFGNVCDAIIENKLNDLFYIVQVSAIGVAKNPDLVKKMRQANFRLTFVGFESMLPSNLKDVSKPANPEINIQAAKLLRDNDIGIIAGLIVGYPDDDARAVRKNWKLMRQLKNDVTWPSYLTPYPKTVIREELLAENLVVNKDDFKSYDGFSCNVRTRYLSRSQLFRTLQLKMLVDHFDVSRIRDGNWFLRNFGFSAARKLVVVNFITILRSLITGRVRKRTFDI